jgi:hypothetical protein
MGQALFRLNRERAAFFGWPRVSAGWAFGRKARWDGQFVTRMRPLATIVTRAAVPVEVAILGARSAVLAWYRSIKGVFRVVAWTEAVRIIHVDEAIAVVVHTVAAVIQKTLAPGFNARTSRDGVL